PVVVAGEFNAHSEEWGCSPRQRDLRGNVVADWAAGLGLVLMNTGSTSTCVRAGGGGSVINLTWASPSAARDFWEWVVEEERESLSDHRYVMWSLR
ncbi:hypothetical protein EAI_07816, partial [Harpegnathos saltator]